MPIDSALWAMHVLEILMQIRTAAFLIQALLAATLALQLGLLAVWLRREARG